MKRPLIIEARHASTGRQKVVFGTLTLAFWAVWTYLWLPVVTFFAWLFGIHTVDDQMFVNGGYKTLQHMLGLYLAIALQLGAALVGWGVYNLIRFRGVERRLPRPIAETSALASHHAVTPDDLARWQGAAKLRVEHDEHGRMTAAQPLELSSRLRVVGES